MSETKTAILRSAYQPPAFWIRTVTLDVDIQTDACIVTAELDVERNAEVSFSDDLILQGRGQVLISVHVDGNQLSPADYSLKDKELTLSRLPDRSLIRLVTSIDPDANTSLEGFYRSGQILCTQCEAHGFSRISYFPDRPDILSVYRVTIKADQSQFPVLLANGNLVASAELDGGRHSVTWEDPHPKPCYLFAMVAGDLACVEDHYRTSSGRDVAIRFYVEAGDEPRCAQAIESLKAAMAWDESTYGLEYDLDLYMVVAVGSFNMGAMENKGLNIFNSKYVLASTETATDTDYELIQAVIGHEYFHNWTGNRVTCRDWFQLSLKEGLTVFREQQFMESSLASSTQRIDQVRMLRSQQFAEDASPMAHPVRPESYIEVNNFYTLTVYEKGAEIIRMMHGLLGQQAFRAGLRHYLEKHDGTAATIDDFVKALSDSSGQDLSGFQAWYSQAGTPHVRVRTEYQQADQTFSLHFEQHIPLNIAAVENKPVPVPVSMRLLNADGQLITDEQLLLSEQQQSFTFGNIAEPPLPVFLRNFSAPVKLEYLYSRDELLQIARSETDGFCRWDAMQKLFEDLVNEQLSAGKINIDPLESIARQFLIESVDDRALAAELLRIPSETLLSEAYDPIPVESLIQARDALETELSARLYPQYLETYHALSSDGAYSFDKQQVGARKLKNLCLHHLALSDNAGQQLAYTQYLNADNMTDRLAALEALNHVACEERELAMKDFSQHWQRDPLVFDKWLSLQATSRLPGALDRVREIHNSNLFDASNPNRIRSLVGSFCMNNMRGFHLADGSAYDWLAEEIIRLDTINPQVASRLCTPLCRWEKLDSARAQLVKAALRRIAARETLSSDVYELVTKALN